MSEIRLLIDDYSAPWAETYCTVQSFKHQQGGVSHVPVQYSVTTDFTGVVTLTTSDGVSHSVTAGTGITTTLDEGGLAVKADATGAVKNGTFYVFLKQYESALELQIRIDVNVAFLECLEYPTFGISSTTVQIDGSCSTTFTFVGAGAYARLTLRYSLPFVNGSQPAVQPVTLYPGYVLEAVHCPLTLPRSASHSAVATIYRESDLAEMSSGVVAFARTGESIIKTRQGDRDYYTNQGTSCLVKQCNFAYPLTARLVFPGQTVYEAYLEFAGTRLDLSSQTEVDIRPLLNSMDIGDQMNFYAETSAYDLVASVIFASGSTLFI